MDPNATLREIRNLIAQHNLGGGGLVEEEVDRLAELIEALDGWLSKGGALPHAWYEKR